jgi:O-antigen/teichoic acid export membrane protein
MSELSKIVAWGSVFALGLAPEILAFLAPKSYADSLYAIAPFALSSLPYFLIGTATVILCYREKSKYVSASAVAGAAANILANFLLIPHLGYVGGAIAYLASQGVTYVLSVLWLKRCDSRAAEALLDFPTMLFSCGFGALLLLIYPYSALRIFLLIIPAIFCLRSGFSALRMAKEK